MNLQTTHHYHKGQPILLCDPVFAPLTALRAGQDHSGPERLRRRAEVEGAVHGDVGDGRGEQSCIRSVKLSSKIMIFDLLQY